MAIITGPDYLLPAYVLESDRKLPEDQRTKWFLRQPETAAAARIKQTLAAVLTSRAFDAKVIDDAMRLVLEGWQNLQCGGEVLSYQEESRTGDLLGQRKASVISAELVPRIPFDWKVELLAHASSPRLTSDDLGN